MIINQAALSGIYKSFKTIFGEAFAGAPSVFERIATVVPSAGREVTYAWLGAFPQLREWLGDRVIANLKASDYTIKNKDFEATVAVPRNDIEDDQIGVWRPMIDGLAVAAKQHPDYLVFSLLAAGFTTLCYDGQYFFDTDHPVGGASVSNHGGGSGTPWYLLCTKRPIKPLVFQSRKPPQFVSMDRTDDESVFMRKEFRYGVDYRANVGFSLWQLAYGSKQTLDATNYAAARAAVMSFKDDQGRPLGLVPDLLVVPPTLESAGRILLENERDAAGATNPWKGTAELLVSPWLA